MLHKNSRERYEKVKRLFHRLMQNFNVDDLEDYLLTVNSMPVWMENDPSLVQEQRDALARFTVDGSIDWQICNQIANRQKHVRPQRQGGPALRVNSVRINPGARGILLQSPQSAHVIGAGDEIIVDFAGGRESALAFVIRTFKHFHYVFELAPIPPVQRHIPKLAELVGF